MRLADQLAVRWTYEQAIRAIGYGGDNAPMLARALVRVGQRDPEAIGPLLDDLREAAFEVVLEKGGEDGLRQILIDALEGSQDR